MKNVILVLILTVLSINVINAQINDDPILLNIAGENIRKSEFVNIYQKNNRSDVIDKKSLEEYVDLFINFKLKVKEAEVMKLDTITSFITELNGYRKQLALPYLTDKEVNDKLLDESYTRLKNDIRASHILIRLDKNASPKDTLLVYNKLLDIRKRIMNGEDFSKLAMEFSEDPSAKGTSANKNRAATKGNGGDLGFFTAFDMVYPFETGAYNLKKGELSMPVRTDFGYHLIKVTDITPAINKVQVAHILISYPQNATADDSIKIKNKIAEAYQKLKNGESFDSIVKHYSDDKASAAKGGVLPWFGVNRMVPEFITNVKSFTKIGDYSAPFQTQYGWHIIKLIDKKEIESYDKMKADLKQRITKDTRSNKSKESFITKIKQEYSYKENSKALTDFYKVVTDSVFKGKWDASLAKELNGVLFTLAGKDHLQNEFTAYLLSHQSKSTPEPIQIYVNRNYRAFVDNVCTEYEDSQLENKYPAFKSLMKEYRDGILLFDLTDRMVWTKAIKDTTGLKTFYDLNKTKYMWGDRTDATIYACLNEKIAKDAYKLVKSASKKGLSDEDIKAKINKDTDKNINIERSKYSKGDNKIIDNVENKIGLTSVINDDKKYVFVNIHKIVGPEPKAINEAKGIITADYQNFLEQEWIKELRSKYPFQINKDVLSTIK